ncbi:ribonuclease T1 [Nocardioides sp. BE266]|uniref:ribonuclease domain-containing protein n=1 Tax=Nocardioides sp. BE266 TaxID=2817725 RepID=UPI002857B409|nr:ribonuclease domain-containing protein [Nocardioides sp. BE266]MDR7253837.1 ribonuclease T1 [Nocardioides sp. BE266]
MAQPTTGRQRYQWGLLLLVAVLLIGWLLTGGNGQDDPEGDTSSSSSSSASSSPEVTGATTPTTTDDTGGDGGTDPESGLPIVQVADLPPEAADTLDLIDAGGPFPEDRDGVTFENREDLLPDHPLGYYKEYTVPTPGSDDRGARRIVVGEDGELYYTGDHYRSFSRIAR